MTHNTHNLTVAQREMEVLCNSSYFIKWLDMFQQWSLPHWGPVPVTHRELVTFTPGLFIYPISWTNNNVRVAFLNGKGEKVFVHFSLVTDIIYITI